MKDIASLLALVSVNGVGFHRIRKLISHFGSAKDVLNSSISELRQVDGIDEKMAQQIKQTVHHAYIDDQLSQVEKFGARIITYWDKDYPVILKKIYDPPVLLYVKGKLSQDCEKNVAVVGTRSPTENGKWIAEQLGSGLARYDIAVVSGMARGIDTHAHRGALKNNGTTYGVLGCGLNVIYPPENKKLYDQVAEHGALISEFPMNTEPAAGHFPKRNRIISGLSLGTVVVEAGEKSGALITAYMALEQGREVFAVPGNIRVHQSKGPHRLIQEGAKLIENVEDILADIPQLKGQQTKKEERDILQLLSNREKMIWEVLSEKPTHIDDITAQVNMDTSEVLALLLSLELKDVVKQLSGMMFVRQ
ncbi:DNA-processing protein DprA [bacterium]|nr:DNA-processing protein DprA [bacterium]